MKVFERKRKLRKSIYSRPSIILLFLVTVFLATGLPGWYEKYSESAENRAQAERALAKLSEREIRLTEEIKALQTERGIEEEIRKKYGYAKEGEREIIVIDDTVPSDNAPEFEEPNIFQRLWTSVVSIFE